MRRPGRQRFQSILAQPLEGCASHKPKATLAEVLAGLHPAGPVPIENLIYYYDWINHAGISPAEMLAILERLIAKGMVRRTGDRFELACEWP